MNKRFASIVAALAMTLSPLTVAAAEFTPSAEFNDCMTEVTDVVAGNPEVDAGLKDGSLILEVTPIDDVNDADLPEEVRDNLLNAREELKDNALSSLIPDLPNADDYVVDAIFDISLENVATNTVVDTEGSLTITTKIDVDGDYILLHNEDGTWKVVPVTHNADGTVTFTVPNLSPFAIIKKEEPSQPNTPSNPGIPSVPSDPNTPVTPGTPSNPGTPSTPSNPNTPATPITPSNPVNGGNIVNTGVKPGTVTNGKGSVAESSTVSGNLKSSTAVASNKNQDVATAANSNWMIAAAGTAAGLAGIVLILKARKGLAK